MKVLVTGANGLLGKAVIRELLDAGHRVRAVVRPTCRQESLPWHGDVDFFQADLRNAKNLREAFEDVDCLVHLAAMIAGSDEAQFVAGPVATERLLAAMAQSTTRRLVLCSSFSVYDWSKSYWKIDENCPMESRRLYRRDGYAIAKVWQERIARDLTARHGWSLTVLRPGFIWGKGNEWCSGAGLQVGSRILVNGPFRRLPLTYVENCAQAFAAAVEAQTDVPQKGPSDLENTFNVIDSDSVRAWQFAGDFIRESGRAKQRIALPDLLFRVVGYAAAMLCRLTLGRNWKLPGVLMPNRYQARFGSRRFPSAKLKKNLHWQPRYSYAEALSRTYDRDHSASLTVVPNSSQSETVEVGR